MISYFLFLSGGQLFLCYFNCFCNIILNQRGTFFKFIFNLKSTQRLKTRYQVTELGIHKENMSHYIFIYLNPT